MNTIFSNMFSNTDVLDPDSVLLKIGDSSSKKLEDVSIVTIFNKESDNYLAEFMKGLGRQKLSKCFIKKYFFFANCSLYEYGYNLQISNLYPNVPVPVSRGTEMISPYIKWNHRKPKYVPKYNVEHLSNEVKYGNVIVSINTEDNEWEYIRGHVIDGQ